MASRYARSSQDVAIGQSGGAQASRHEVPLKWTHN